LRSCLVAALLAAVSVQPAWGQRAREWQVQGLAVVARSSFAGGGLGFAFRSWGRLRVGATATFGTADGRLAGRGEAALSYHVNPVRRSGFTPYAGGGVALTASDSVSTEYLTLFLGVESTPGRPLGVFAEVGVGGGLRLSAGLRLRRFARRR
jgi:hypothetical protein